MQQYLCNLPGPNPGRFFLFNEKYFIYPLVLHNILSYIMYMNNKQGTEIKMNNTQKASIYHAVCKHIEQSHYIADFDVKVTTNLGKTKGPSGEEIIYTFEDMKRQLLNDMHDMPFKERYAEACRVAEQNDKETAVVRLGGEYDSFE